MEKTVKIDGMMCMKCEAKVKKAFEELPEVDEAIVNKDTKSAVLKLNADLSDDAIKAVVEGKYFTFLGVE